MEIMKKVTGEANTQPKQQEEVSQTQYSQKIRDFIGKTIGFKTATEGLLIFVFAVALIVRIGFAIYTQNPYLLTPEAMPSQVTPEVLQEAPKIHLTV